MTRREQGIDEAKQLHDSFILPQIFVTFEQEHELFAVASANAQLARTLLRRYHLEITFQNMFYITSNPECATEYYYTPLMVAHNRVSYL